MWILPIMGRWHSACLSRAGCRLCPGRGLWVGALSGSPVPAFISCLTCNRIAYGWQPLGSRPRRLVSLTLLVFQRAPNVVKSRPLAPGIVLLRKIAHASVDCLRLRVLATFFQFPSWTSSPCNWRAVVVLRGRLTGPAAPGPGDCLHQ